MMSMWLMMSIGVLVIILVIFLFSVLASRGFGKRKREEVTKPKRDEHSRLILSEDGELVDFTASEDEDAQRSRDS